MVTMYGMSERFGMVQLEGITGEYLDRRAMLQCSDETATLIDEEVRMIIGNAYARALKILGDNIEILDAIATYLIDHESITGKEFMDIFNQVTGGVMPEIDRGLSLTSGDLTGGQMVNAFGTGASKVKMKKNDKTKSEKKTKKKKKDKLKDTSGSSKYKVYASPEFEKKRDALLNDEAEDEYIEAEDSSEEMEKRTLEETADSSDAAENNARTASDDEGMKLPWD